MYKGCRVRPPVTPFLPPSSLRPPSLPGPSQAAVSCLGSDKPPQGVVGQTLPPQGLFFHSWFHYHFLFSSLHGDDRQHSTGLGYGPRAVGGDNSQTEAPPGLVPPPPAPSTMETSGCGRYAPPPPVEMRLQISCDPGSAAASPPAHPLQPRARLLRLSGWAPSPSSLALSPEETLS